MAYVCDIANVDCSKVHALDGMQEKCKLYSGVLSFRKLSYSIII